VVRVIIPLSIVRFQNRRPVITWTLLALNILIHIFMVALTKQNPQLKLQILDWAMYNPQAPKPLALITYAFFHADFWHLLGNMLILWVFGPSVEDVLRKWGFTLLYLVGGIVAAFLHSIFEDAPVIGASGAIAAVTGAFLVMFPKTYVKVLWFFILIGFYTLPAWIFIALAIAKDFLLTGIGNSNVATIAHIGGYILGFALSFALLATKIVPSEQSSLVFMFKQSQRRNAMRKAFEDGTKERTNPTIRLTDLQQAQLTKLTALRAQIGLHISKTDTSRALASYDELLALTRSISSPEALGLAKPLLLSRRLQMDLANALFASARHAEAANAYTLFAENYPDDPHAPRAWLLVALVHMRYTSPSSNHPAAKVALKAIKAPFADPQEDALAKQLLAEIQAAQPTGPDQPIGRVTP
jgi:membrane associated rhomboid family serine protease